MAFSMSPALRMLPQMGDRQKYLAGLLAILLFPMQASADQRPVRMSTGCAAFSVGNQSEPPACVRCKPGYHLSSARTCMRLGDFGSRRDAILPRALRR